MWPGSLWIQECDARFSRTLSLFGYKRQKFHFFLHLFLGMAHWSWLCVLHLINSLAHVDGLEASGGSLKAPEGLLNPKTGISGQGNVAQVGTSFQPVSQERSNANPVVFYGTLVPSSSDQAAVEGTIAREQPTLQASALPKLLCWNYLKEAMPRTQWNHHNRLGNNPMGNYEGLGGLLLESPTGLLYWPGYLVIGEPGPSAEPPPVSQSRGVPLPTPPSLQSEPSEIGLENRKIASEGASGSPRRSTASKLGPCVKTQEKAQCSEQGVASGTAPKSWASLLENKGPRSENLEARTMKAPMDSQVSLLKEKKPPLGLKPVVSNLSPTDFPKFHSRNKDHPQKEGAWVNEAHKTRSRLSQDTERLFHEAYGTSVSRIPSPKDTPLLGSALHPKEELKMQSHHQSLKTKIGHSLSSSQHTSTTDTTTLSSSAYTKDDMPWRCRHPRSFTLQDFLSPGKQSQHHLRPPKDNHNKTPKPLRTPSEFKREPVMLEIRSGREDSGLPRVALDKSSPEGIPHDHEEVVGNSFKGPDGPSDLEPGLERAPPMSVVPLRKSTGETDSVSIRAPSSSLPLNSERVKELLQSNKPLSPPVRNLHRVDDRETSTPTLSGRKGKLMITSEWQGAKNDRPVLASEFPESRPTQKFEKVFPKAQLEAGSSLASNLGRKTFSDHLDNSQVDRRKQEQGKLELGSDQFRGTDQTIVKAEPFTEVLAPTGPRSLERVSKDKQYIETPRRITRPVSPTPTVSKGGSKSSTKNTPERKLEVASSFGGEAVASSTSGVYPSPEGICDQSPDTATASGVTSSPSHDPIDHAQPPEPSIAWSKPRDNGQSPWIFDISLEEAFGSSPKNTAPVTSHQRSEPTWKKETKKALRKYEFEKLPRSLKEDKSAACWVLLGKLLQSNFETSQELEGQFKNEKDFKKLQGFWLKDPHNYVEAERWHLESIGGFQGARKVASLRKQIQLYNIKQRWLSLKSLWMSKKVLNAEGAQKLDRKYGITDGLASMSGNTYQVEVLSTPPTRVLLNKIFGAREAQRRLDLIQYHGRGRRTLWKAEQLSTAEKRGADVMKIMKLTEALHMDSIGSLSLRSLLRMRIDERFGTALEVMADTSSRFPWAESPEHQFFIDFSADLYSQKLRQLIEKINRSKISIQDLYPKFPKVHDVIESEMRSLIATNPRWWKMGDVLGWLEGGLSPNGMVKAGQKALEQGLISINKSGDFCSHPSPPGPDWNEPLSMLRAAERRKASQWFSSHDTTHSPQIQALRILQSPIQLLGGLPTWIRYCWRKIIQKTLMGRDRSRPYRRRARGRRFGQ